MGNSKSKDKKKDGAGSSGASSSSSSAASCSHDASTPGIHPPHRGSVDRGSVVDDPAGVLANGSEFAPSAGAEPTLATQEAAISFWDKGKTFRPQRAVPDAAGTKGAGGRMMKTVQATMKATLGGGDLENAVKCPQGEDKNEWIAVNTVQFYNAASLIYGTVVQYCTPATCPTMAAGKAEYLWKDDTAAYKKPTRIPAPVYIDLMMSEIDAQITDETIFPVEENVKFPRNYLSVVKSIYKRLFRLYAHVYCSHIDRIRSIGASAHLNTTFKHLVYFILEHDLVTKTEMQPLERLIAKFTTPEGGIPSASSSSSSGK